MVEAYRPIYNLASGRGVSNSLISTGGRVGPSQRSPMKCPRCQTFNRAEAKFCEECAAPLARTCANCGHQLSPSAKFCPECACPTVGSETLQASVPDQSPFGSPETYTPDHLARKILTSKSALEGERKQVTVLFADLKASMELLADRDPEEARKLLAPVLEHMMEAVHHYEGTVNQVAGDGIMALFGAPLAHETPMTAGLGPNAKSRPGLEMSDVRRRPDVMVCISLAEVKLHGLNFL